MKLLFLGLSPSPSLQKILAENSFSVEVETRNLQTLSPEKSSPVWDLIAYRTHDSAGIKGLTLLKKRFPNAWLAAVVSKVQLSDSTFHNELLKSNDKSDVWFEDDWEIRIWYSLQQMIQHQRILDERETLRGEAQSARTSYEELFSSSHRAIEQLEKDVKLASNIQKSLLPKISPQIPGVEIAVKYIPAAGLGGDYYDIFEFGDKKRFGILIADSKTHGMAATLLTILLKIRLEEMKDRFPDSKSFVNFLSQQIQQLGDKEGAHLSLLYGILDRSKLTFQYTAAGPLAPLHWRDNEIQKFAPPSHPPLGMGASSTFEEHTLNLLPGDLLILHTDGLEAPLKENQKGSGTLTLTDLLKGHSDPADPMEIRRELLGLVDRYLDRKPLEDDLTLIQLAIEKNALYLPQSKFKGPTLVKG